MDDVILDKSRDISEYLDVYFDRMDKITSICSNIFMIDEAAGEDMLKKFTPTIDLLSKKLDKTIQEYTREHGEL